jgi:ribosome-associated toxin RatA of RatAB toxin-antitoxin module
MILCLVFLGLSVGAQDSWELKTDKDGIKVYKSADSRSKFDQLKLECTIDASLSSLVAVLLDVSSYPQWVYHTRTASVLKKVSDHELYFYEQIESPFGTSDRDLVVVTKINQDKDTKVVHVTVKSVPDYIPQKKGFVRVPMSDEKWTITPLSKNSIRIDYNLEIDPGGSVPAWLVNQFSQKGPYESFRQLRKHVSEEKYRNASFPFIAN